jgi:transmembrane sensor
MRLLHRETPPEVPADAAIWWATCRQTDPVRFANENAAFSAWLADEINASAWQEVDRRVEMVGKFATMPHIREMRRAALEAARFRPRPARRGRIVAGVMAASLFGVTLWTGLSVWAPGDTLAASENVRRYATAIGQSRDVLLSDGSKVTLNTASLVEVRYTAARRDVRLLTGQAMFQVAKNPDRPFVVWARDRQVTALGTAFDVRIRGDGVQVLLVEGHVRVDPVRPQGLARLIPALARTDLTAGQQLLTEGASAGEVMAVDVERETAWNRGVLIFRNDSVGDAVREVNRYSQVPIVVDDPGVANLKVSGIFPTASQADFIAAMEALYPVRTRSEQGGVIRLGWRPGVRDLQN